MEKKFYYKSVNAGFVSMTIIMLITAFLIVLTASFLNFDFKLLNSNPAYKTLAGLLIFGVFYFEFFALSKLQKKSRYIKLTDTHVELYKHNKLDIAIPITSINAVEDSQGKYSPLAGYTSRMIGFNIQTDKGLTTVENYMEDYQAFTDALKLNKPDILQKNLQAKEALRIANYEIVITKAQVFKWVLILIGIILLFVFWTNIIQPMLSQ